MPTPTNGDKNWDTRRVRLDYSLGATFGCILLSIFMGSETAAAVAPPGFIAIGLLIGAYFGFVGKERVDMATRVTEEIEKGTPPKPVVTKTIETVGDLAPKPPAKEG